MANPVEGKYSYENRLAGCFPLAKIRLFPEKSTDKGA